MVCGQIHAPATLPNYVHMHLMNKALRTSFCLFLKQKKKLVRESNPHAILIRI